MTLPPRNPWFSKIALGLLVAATGVGAGDLITASLAGSHLGLVILWAAVAGAALKWVLNEGIARWQMATSTTILEGWVKGHPGLFEMTPPRAGAIAVARRVLPSRNATESPPRSFSPGPGGSTTTAQASFVTSPL